MFFFERMRDEVYIPPEILNDTISYLPEKAPGRVLKSFHHLNHDLKIERIRDIYNSDIANAARVGDWRSVQFILNNIEEFPQLDTSIYHVYQSILRYDRDDILELLIDEYPEIMNDIGPINLLEQAIDADASRTISLIVKVYDLV